MSKASEGIKVACDSRGNYRREIGWKRTDGGYRQHCFHLGKDRAQAAHRSLDLERVWDAVVKRWQRDRLTERPLWDTDTLAIGSAVAKGERTVRLNHAEGVDMDRLGSSGAQLAAAWLTQFRHDFPFIKIDLADAETQAEGLERLQQAAERHEQTAKWLRLVSGSQTLHQALDAFAEFIRQTCLTPDKRLSPYGVSKCGQVKQIKEHAQDMPLGGFDLNAIEMMLHHWRNRPAGRRSGKPMSAAHCKDIIKRIREFLRWLHRNPAFEWKRPVDYETQPLRVPLTHEEVAARFSPLQVPTYTVEQLGVLYDYASPTERLMLLLALNCGFGAAEVTSLQLSELFLDQPHGHYALTASFIKRLRFKSTVYAEWQLWPVTAEGIRWFLARRPQCKSPVLLVTEKGRPFGGQTASGNRNQRIQNIWKRLRDRIAKDRAAFPALSFNKLRKTAGDLVKRVSDGETAGVFLSHGQTVKSDTLADVYTNRHFDRVFAALERVREMLSPVFSNVPDPFPLAYRKRHPSISLGTIRKVQALRAEGLTIHAIAEQLELADETVRYYCRPEQAV
jgi:hypothetical protein